MFASDGGLLLQPTTEPTSSQPTTRPTTAQVGIYQEYSVRGHSEQLNSSLSLVP